jgi:uncharacterized protein (DUF1015 family)
MQINSFRPLLPPEQFGSEIDVFCDAARNHLSKAFLPYKKPDPQRESLLIIEIISDNTNSIGLVCLTDIHDYRENRLKAHEEIIPLKLKKQKDYLAKQGTFIKPVLAAVEDDTVISTWMAERMQHPVFKSFHSLKKKQFFNLWLVDDASSIGEMKEIFKVKVPQAMIADGHHRCAACKELFEEGDTRFKYLLTAYFPVSQLNIHAFHRIYSLNSEADSELILAHLANHLRLTSLSSPIFPENKHELLIGFKNIWYRGIFKHVMPHLPDLIRFEELLPSIIDPKHVSRIHYPEDDASIQSFAKSRKNGPLILALSFFPIPKEDWISAVKRNLFFPPKSTRFMPTLRSGLTMFDFNKRNTLKKDEPLP